MQCGDLVEILAALIEAPGIAHQHLLKNRFINCPAITLRCQVTGNLQQIEGTAGTIGGSG